MTFARLADASATEFKDIRPPFSNFQFVDSLLPDNDYSAVRRLFSLARKDGLGNALILEDIEPLGAVEDEIAEISALFPGYQCTGLKRLTFWSRLCTSLEEMGQLTDGDLLGYAILKRDSVPLRPPRWHVFESVFRKYGHKHNCIPGEPFFTLRCGTREYRLNGVMYCQQNGLNKACAQVALRSLLSRILCNQDVNYSEMNTVARKSDPALVPGTGLATGQIRAILEHHGVRYDDFDYIATPTDPLPYARLVYAGVENGLGALLGFELSGAGAHEEKHIIPFYGHTFNQDTWVPRASLAYFHVGDNTQYISSVEWMSSFVGHDDNFGGNYCVPRKFLEPDQVKYVVALRPADTEYGAIEAEAFAVNCLYATVNTLPQDNYWIRRLIRHITVQDVVLRTLYVTRNQYVEHLEAGRDWFGHAEKPEILSRFATDLPEHLWMVEISIPELFPANYRKLGEILLDARVPLEPSTPHESLWVVARFPGSYLINDNPVPGSASFGTLDSNMDSHTPLYGTLEP